MRVASVFLPSLVTLARGVVLLACGTSTADAACADFWTRTGSAAPAEFCAAIDTINAKGAVPIILGKEGCKSDTAVSGCALWSFPMPVSEFAAILSFDAKGSYGMMPIRTEGVTDEHKEDTEQLLRLAQETYGEGFSGFKTLKPGEWLITEPTAVDRGDPFQSFLLEKQFWIDRQLDQGFSVVMVVRGD